jgi:hypothetical protein
MGIHAFTFASPNFRHMAKIVGLSCLKSDYSSFRVFSSEDFTEEFRLENHETLNLERGSGYWLWKPFFYLCMTQQFESTEVIHYLDAGTIPKLNAEKFDSLVSDDRIHVWSLDDSRLSDWTEPNVLKELSAEQFKDYPMIQASGILSRNNEELKRILEEWLVLCKDPKLLRPETLDGYIKSPGFIWHRHDMSLLTILVYRNPNLFFIHGAHTLDDVAKFYFQHRNEGINFVFKVFTFERLVTLRRTLVSHLPYRLRTKLRERKTLSQKKNLTSSELESLKKIY